MYWAKDSFSIRPVNSNAGLWSHPTHLPSQLSTETGKSHGNRAGWFSPQFCLLGWKSWKNKLKENDRKLFCRRTCLGRRNRGAGFCDSASLCGAQVLQDLTFSWIWLNLLNSVWPVWCTAQVWHTNCSNLVEYVKKSWFLLNCSSFKSVSTWLNSWYVGWTKFGNCPQSAAFCTAHIWNNFRRVNELFLHRPNPIFNSSVYPKLINLVYRANPTDNPNNLNGFFGSSRSVAKGAYGIGDVVVEPLRDVWKVRKYGNICR